MHSVRLEPTKLILIGTRITYQATGDTGYNILLNKNTSIFTYKKSQNIINQQTTNRYPSNHLIKCNIPTLCRNYCVRFLIAAITSVSLRAATNVDWLGLLWVVYLLVHGKVGPLALVRVSCVYTGTGCCAKAGMNRGILYSRPVVCQGREARKVERHPRCMQCMYKSTFSLILGAPYRTNNGHPGTWGKNTRDSVSWAGTVPVPTVPGTRHRVPGSESDGCNSKV